MRYHDFLLAGTNPVLHSNIPVRHWKEDQKTLHKALGLTNTTEHGSFTPLLAGPHLFVYNHLVQVIKLVHWNQDRDKFVTITKFNVLTDIEGLPALTPRLDLLASS